MDKPVIDLKDISKVYGQYEKEIRAIDRVSLSIFDSEFVAITGPSGSGKSTLLHLMGLLDRPTEGTVFMDGLNTSTITGEEIAKFRGKKIGFVFQTYNIIPRLSVIENVMLPGIIQELPLDEVREKAQKLLEETGIAHRANHKGAHLSGGEQQKAAIARALINDPSVILADEPTGALDSKNSDSIMEILRRMNASRNVTTIFVTHDNRQAKYAKRIIELQDGRIIKDGKNEEVLGR
jgi:ABC-type lipoprotein export system ATPase subunit